MALVGGWYKDLTGSTNVNSNVYKGCVMTDSSGAYFVESASVFNNTTATTGSRLIIHAAGVDTTGTIAGTNLAGTLTTAAQPNVTSVGTLTSLSVGNVGIGQAAGTERLEVTGNMKATGSLTIGSGGTYTDGSIYSDPSWGMLFRAGSEGAQALFSFANTSDTKLLSISTNGNVGIGILAPTEKMHVNGSVHATSYKITTSDGQGGTRTGNLAYDGNNTSRWFTGGGEGLLVQGNLESTATITCTGRLGVATSTHYAPVHINSVNSGTLSSSERSMFIGGDNTLLIQETSLSSFSLYASGHIITGDAIIAQSGTIGASDERIKINIQNISDTMALEQLRLLQPKTYQYKDTAKRGTEDVIGFIAQEVADVIPGAVSTGNDFVPNIYELAIVSGSNTIKFEKFDTTNLISNASTLLIKSLTNGEKRASISRVIDANTIEVEEDITALAGSIDENGEVIAGNKIFVYGQEVDDFNFLKKEAIFTVATAALQEVDRQQVADKARIATLETQIADLLSRIQALENP